MGYFRYRCPHGIDLHNDCDICLYSCERSDERSSDAEANLANSPTYVRAMETIAFKIAFKPEWEMWENSPSGHKLAAIEKL